MAACSGQSKRVRPDSNESSLISFSKIPASSNWKANGSNLKPNDKIRLFYSYRHTPAKAAELLRQQKLIIQEQWVTNSQQEGVFMCCRGE